MLIGPCKFTEWAKAKYTTVSAYLFMTDTTGVDGWSVGVGGVEDHGLVRWVHLVGSPGAVHHARVHSHTLGPVGTLGVGSLLGVETRSHLHLLHHAG